VHAISPSRQAVAALPLIHLLFMADSFSRWRENPAALARILSAALQ
jgi:hypothetical protein